MPTYLYRCPECDYSIDIIKQMSQASEPETCSACLRTLERVYTAPQLNTSICQFNAHFNYGLGKAIHKKSDIRDELRRVKDTTGRELVEIGDDRQESVKKRKKDYTLTKEDYDIALATIEQATSSSNSSST